MDGMISSNYKGLCSFAAIVPVQHLGEKEETVARSNDIWPGVFSVVITKTSAPTQNWWTGNFMEAPNRTQVFDVSATMPWATTCPRAIVLRDTQSWSHNPCRGCKSWLLCRIAQLQGHHSFIKYYLQYLTFDVLGTSEEPIMSDGWPRKRYTKRDSTHFSWHSVSVRLSGGWPEFPLAFTTAPGPTAIWPGTGHRHCSTRVAQLVATLTTKDLRQRQPKTLPVPLSEKKRCDLFLKRLGWIGLVSLKNWWMGTWLGHWNLQKYGPTHPIPSCWLLSAMDSFLWGELWWHNPLQIRRSVAPI